MFIIFTVVYREVDVAVFTEGVVTQSHSETTFCRKWTGCETGHIIIPCTFLGHQMHKASYLIAL